MREIGGEFPAMNNLNSLLNLQEIHSHGQLSSSPYFDPTSSNDDFLEQILSSVPSSAAGAASSFPWADDQSPGLLPHLGDQSAASKMRHPQISNAAAKALMLQQQQQFFSRTLAAANGFRSPPGGDDGLLSIPQDDDDGTSFNSDNPLRRERIAERMKGLQELVPNANKTDKASMLDEIIDYVKFLQLQVKVLSMSRLGGAGAGALAPLVTDTSSEGRGGNRTQTAASSSNNNNNEGMAVAEHQVAKLMEDDMGSAMQYLQGKGLCLMPISLATAISTATCHSRNPIIPSSSNHLSAGPISPTMSVHSATVDAGEPSSLMKGPTSVSKP
ncbi:hypothetical protein MIMGU_mgv1a009878mg [Erythranthe guttata]|uniref:BHLH domain-containing protein n=1 Tax=Erythranthe guttata TaxID=4155 RepID=A0A022QW19_ERYGU|nr:hypothetical protein MIMGU_mgv1a009878mg [Erythranthe guttata]